MKYFVVKGCAGLGNRLVTLCQAISYAQKTNRTLLVDWRDGMLGGRNENIFWDYFTLKDCDFTEALIEDVAEKKSVYPLLWEANLATSIYDRYSEAKLFTKTQRRWLLLSSLGKWKLTQAYISLHCHETDKIQGFGSLKKQVEMGELLPMLSEYPLHLDQECVIGSDYFPPFLEEIFRKHVFLKPGILKKLTDVASELEVGEQTLGIHVRQTDWNWKTDLSILLQHLQSASTKQFKNIFLATDSLGALNQIKEVVPNVMATKKFLPEPKTGGLHHWSYDKNNPALARSMFEESLADQFLLSRCGSFWMQAGSSFSMIAKAMASKSQKRENWSDFKEETQSLRQTGN